MKKLKCVQPISMICQSAIKKDIVVVITKNVTGTSKPNRMKDRG